MVRDGGASIGKAGGGGGDTAETCKSVQVEIKFHLTLSPQYMEAIDLR